MGPPLVNVFLGMIGQKVLDNIMEFSLYRIYFDDILMFVCNVLLSRLRRVNEMLASLDMSSVCFDKFFRLVVL